MAKILFMVGDESNDILFELLWAGQGSPVFGAVTVEWLDFIFCHAGSDWLWVIGVPIYTARCMGLAI